MRRRPLVLLMLAMPALCSPSKSSRAAPAEVKVGQTLPDALLLGLNGHSRRLSDYRGKPLVINVWASWCGPCKQEMASLERLAWLELARNFSVIGISTDDYRQQALNWLAQSHSTISQFIDNRREMENLLDAFKIPLTVLVGADGRVLQKVYGAREWDAPPALQLLRETFAL
jgi:peroxiredoxin